MSRFKLRLVGILADYLKPKWHVLIENKNSAALEYHVLIMSYQKRLNMHHIKMKQRRHISILKIRLMLIIMVAVHFPNMVCVLTSQISAVLSETTEYNIPSFLDIDFSNITALDIASRKAMEYLHDDLDDDDDGNVSMSEGAQFIGEEFVHSSRTNLPGFATDKDGRITAAEFWENWVKSPVHNWTVVDMVEWLSRDVDLPQYAGKFKHYGISGAAMPILASNSSLVLSLVDGIKEHRLKLWLKAMEVVLCGPSRSKSSWLKDVLLTVSIALALSGVAFGVHVRRSATVAMATMQSTLNNLQKEMNKINEEENWEKDLPGKDELGSKLNTNLECNSSTSCLDSELALHTKLHETMEELADTKMMLEKAEERLSGQRWSPPSRLITCLKCTHQVESRLHELKREQAQKKVEQAKSQFQKMKKKSSILSSVHFIHSRHVDSFDVDVQNAKDLLRQIQRDSHEFKKRWIELESICRYKFLTSSSTSSIVSSSGPVVVTLRREEQRNEAENLKVTDDGSENNRSIVTSLKHRSSPSLTTPSDPTLRSLSFTSSRHKDVRIIPEDVKEVEERQTYPRKNFSPKLRKNDSVQSCIIITAPPTDKVFKENSYPRRAPSFGGADRKSSLHPGQKSTCSRSLPELFTDESSLKSGFKISKSEKSTDRSTTNGDVTARSTVSRDVVDRSTINGNVTKSVKRKTFGSIFKRKKKV